MLKRWLIVLFQTAVTAALLAFFFRDPEFRTDISAALKSTTPGWLVAGICFAGMENLVGVCRWRIFLKMLRIELPFWKSVQICLVALFCNTFLVGAAGGDLVRAAYLMRRGNSKIDSLLSVILDRISGLGGLILCTAVLTVWNYEWLSRSPKVMTLVQIVIAYQIGCAALLTWTLSLAASGWTANPPRWAPFPNILRKFGAGYAQMAYQWRASLRAMALTLVMLIAYFGVFYASARAFSVDISFLQMSAIMPAADIITALPISIGGLGVREQVFAFLLSELSGVLAATAVSISLVGFLMNTSWGLAGAAALPFFRGVVRDARTAADTVREEI